MALAHTSFTPAPGPFPQGAQSLDWGLPRTGSLAMLTASCLGAFPAGGSQDFGFHLLGGKEER